MNIFSPILAALVVFWSGIDIYAHLPYESATRIEVVELREFEFRADSFFGERTDSHFKEVPAGQKYLKWSEEAVNRVNSVLPIGASVPSIKIRLIFKAQIMDLTGVKRLTPISLIESYQEPKTNSIRLGMLELAEDKESFQLTVAHEYAHLVFERATRTAGSTPNEEENLKFWPKSLYEGAADLVMGLAMSSDHTAGPSNWSAKSLNEFKTRKEAKKARDGMATTARQAFKKMGLIPKYPIYENWLKTIDTYIASLGGTDPYAEGRWMAGSLKRKAHGKEISRKIISLILNEARSGKMVTDIGEFHDLITRQL